MLRLQERYPQVSIIKSMQLRICYIVCVFPGSHSIHGGKSYNLLSNEQFSGQFSDQTIEETLMQKAKSNGSLTRGRMRNENSVKVWVGTFSHLKLLGDLMGEMIGGKWSKRIHKDLGAKRMKNDSQCVKLLFEWFSTHDPFTEVSTHVLRVLQTSCYI